MNPHPTLDLEYPDPPIPAQLLERSRRQGRTIRRRRRIALAAGAMVIVAGAPVIAQTVNDGVGGRIGHLVQPADPSGPALDEALAKLPVSVGRGPSASHFAAAGYGVNSSDDGLTHGPPAGRVISVRPAGHGNEEQVMWISKDAMFLLGSRATPSSMPQETLGRPLNHLPAEGFWGGVTLGENSAGPNQSRPSVTIIAGLVRGPVTRVDIKLPGGTVAAHLSPAPNPELGTFYWLTTDVFDSSFKVLPQFRDPKFGPTANSVTRTVYRGNRPVFHCDSSVMKGDQPDLTKSCTGEHG